MVKIRLRRTGAKKQPSYRVVVADSRSPRDGRFIEIIGHYNPRTEPATINIQEDRALYWLSVGAQMSDPVERLLKNLGTLDRFARLKEGADLEELMAEAEAAREKHAAEAEARAAKAAEEKEAEKQAEVKEEAESTEIEAEAEEASEAEVSEGVAEEAAVDAEEASSEDAQS